MYPKVSRESTVSFFRVKEKDVRRSDIGSVVSPSGTAGGLCLSCPVGLPGAYDVHCGAQWDCRGLCPSCPLGLPGVYDVLCEAQFDYFKSMIGYVCETQWDYCRIMMDCKVRDVN